MNKFTAAGFLTAPASITTTASGRDVLNFTVALNEGQDSKGNDIVEYVPVSVFGAKGFAAKIQPYLGKGASVIAIGKLTYSQNTKDKDVYTNARVELRSLRDLELIGGKGNTTAAAAAADTSTTDSQPTSDSAAQAASDSPVATGDAGLPAADQFDDDIPF